VVDVAREYGIVVVFLAMFVSLSLASSVFLTSQNLLNVLQQQAAPYGLLACALTFVVIGGEFDLSPGATVFLVGIVAAKLEPSVGVTACFLIAIVVGIAIGVVNGMLVTVAKINSFVATLATSIIIDGLGLVITNGFQIAISKPSFQNLGLNDLWDAQYSIWIWLLFAIITAFILGQTRYGRWLFAVGGNSEAARLSGLNVGQIKTLAFALSGFAAGLAGVILVSAQGQGQADSGAGLLYTLNAFAAVVIGGTSVAGGRGAMSRTVLGVLFLGLIVNGFDLLGFNPTYQQIVSGAIILLAVGVDAVWSRQGA
jgi:ribose transport system permease protein